jgi:ricin-type beta-trefoil lectin protein
VPAIGAVSSLTAQTTSAIGWEPPSGTFAGTYEVQNVNSGLAMNVHGNSTNQGEKIVQSPFAGGERNSLWRYVSAGVGYYRIQSVSSGLYVNVSSDSRVIGGSMIQWPQASGDNDRWLPVKNSDGTYSFVNLANGLALEVPGGSKAADTQLTQWYPNGAATRISI